MRRLRADTSGMRVLVVDDDPVIRELLTAELDVAGHEVTVASDGRDGLEVIRRDRPDALVLDVMMPTVSGWDVLQQLRADSDYDDVPIVLLSARDVPDDVRHGYALGASLVMSKPCDGEQLVSLLEVLRPDAAAQ